MKMNLVLELLDAPGQLVKVLEPISMGIYPSDHYPIVADMVL